MVRYKLCSQNRQYVNGWTKIKGNIKEGVIADFVSKIDSVDKKRALEISAFYNDLVSSIKKVAGSIKKEGKQFT
jgi:hypothetical protein